MERPQANSDVRMGFWDHLEELRVRLLRVLYVFMLGFVAAYFLLAEPIMGFLRKPLFEALPEEQRKLYFTNLFENFLTHLKISGYASIAILSPYVFWELWKFLAPGLEARERKLVVPFITAATGFFVLGASFAYYVLFPKAFSYFVNYGTSQEVPLLTIDAYYGTCMKLILLFGAAFEFPVILTLFGVLGIWDAATLRTQRKTAFLGITVVSALVAPPDAISMLILMAPLYLMYEGSIVVVAWIEKKKAKNIKEITPVDPAPPSGGPPSGPMGGQSR